MKSLDQIVRYTSRCQFSDKNWQSVLDYCRLNYGGGKIHRAKKPVAESTYNKFLKWIDTGFGPGDIVKYGKTVGIIKDSLPGNTTLAAYCDYEGNLIVKDMDVIDPKRIRYPSEEECLEFREKMNRAGVSYFIRLGIVGELYTPDTYSFISFDEKIFGCFNVGIYLKSNDCNYDFLAFMKGDTLKTEYSINSKYAPVRMADNKEIKALFNAISAAGLCYNERTHTLSKTINRGTHNKYWYLNDRLSLEMDIDNGTQRHTQRYKAGNYFSQAEEAYAFMMEVQKLARGDA